MRQEGYLTVFLAMVLGICIALAVALIDGGYANGVRMKIWYATDTSMQSVLAEYHRDLLERYDVFFIDTSYESTKPDLEKVCCRAMYYLNQNLIGTDFEANSTLMGIVPRNFQIMEASFAGDDGGAVLRRQISDYEKHKYGIQFFEQWLQKGEKYMGMIAGCEQVDEKWNEVDRRLAEIEMPRRTNEEGEEEEIALENPADDIRALRNGENVGLLLQMVLGDKAATVSKQHIGIQTTVSTRKRMEGQGVSPLLNWKEGVEDGLYFDWYIRDKLGSYTNLKENHYMKYQLEYLIAGEGADQKNLEKVVMELLGIREAFNTAYIFTDQEKRAQARMVALSLTAVSLQPELIEPVTVSILLGWAFAESINDVSVLMNGGKIALVKDGAHWRTSLWSALGRSAAKGGSGDTEGMDYTDYLLLLLMPHSSREKTYRLMDMMEWDIRQLVGNENFRMDGCMDSFLFRGCYMDKRGRLYELTRRYAYQ